MTVKKGQLTVKINGQKKSRKSDTGTLKIKNEIGYKDIEIDRKENDRIEKS